MCNGLIEETARHRKLIFACWSILTMNPLSCELRQNMSTHHGIMT